MVARFASYFGCAHAVFFVGKYFVVHLSTTKTTKILPHPEKYPLYGRWYIYNKVWSGEAREAGETAGSQGDCRHRFTPFCVTYE